MTWDREVVSVCTAPVVTGPVSGGEPLASLGTPCREHLAAARGRGARTETVAALADEFARLIGPFHVSSPADLGRAWCLPYTGWSGSGASLRGASLANKNKSRRRCHPTAVWRGV